LESSHLLFLKFNNCYLQIYLKLIIFPDNHKILFVNANFLFTFVLKVTLVEYNLF